MIRYSQNLSDLGIITIDVKNWADTVRWIGNDAVHINANEVEREDAGDILKLTEQLFHIVNIAPAIAAERLKKDKMLRK